ncbi:MAG: LysM peptidoglycan-binding domain-containing protein [Acidimicrobiia bacterium]
MRVGAGVRRLVVAVVVSTALVPIGAGAPVSGAGSGCSSGEVVYEVRTGDGWFAIGQRAGVSVSTLLAVNDAELDDDLHPGDQMCLPAGADLTGVCPATATVRSGDGWSSIARRAGVSVAAVLAANGASVDGVLHPDDVVCLPAGSEPDGAGSRDTSAPGSGGDYTVVGGDSWYWIAERAGTSVRALVAVNGATVDTGLHPGQEIRLPEGASTPSSSGTSGGGGSGRVELQALPTQGPCWDHDTWGDHRSGGRRHVGVDVFTVPGEYVYAVADGRLTLRKWAQPGNISGNAWRLTGDDGTAYFYAHLSDFAPGLSEGSRVRAGQIIGWIGRTGNTVVDHLHFEIRPGGGSPINPYPILRAQGGACNVGTPYTQPGGWVPD